MASPVRTPCGRSLLDDKISAFTISKSYVAVMLVVIRLNGDLPAPLQNPSELPVSSTAWPSQASSSVVMRASSAIICPENAPFFAEFSD